MSIGSGVGIAGIGGVEVAGPDIQEGVLAVVTDSTLNWVGASIFDADLVIATSSSVAWTMAAVGEMVLAVSSSSTVAMTGASAAGGRFTM